MGTGGGRLSLDDDDAYTNIRSNVKVFPQQHERYAVAVAAGPPVSATFSFGILILIASSLTLAGPRSCPFGTPAILEFLRIISR